MPLTGVEYAPDATTTSLRKCTDTSHLNTETGKFELAQSNLLVYVHGGYYGMGPKIGKFGWSVEKKK